MDRITVINKSLHGFICGLLGLIPVLGLVPAVAAVFIWLRVRREYRDWNPASHYLLGGAVLGFISIGILVAAIAIIAVSIVARLAGSAGVYLE